MNNSCNIIGADLAKTKINRGGFIDYNVDFIRPDTGVSFHWWEENFTAKHYHNHYEFFILTQGKAKHIVDNNTYLLKKGSMAFVKPDYSHQLLGNEEEPYRHMNIAVTPKKLEQLCEAFLPNMKDIICETDYCHIVLSDSELDFFLDCAEQINMCKNNYKNSSDAEILFINKMLLNALSILYLANQKLHDDYPQWLSELLDMLRTREVFSYSLSDIYNLTNYSPAALLKHFKRYTGETMISFLTRQKINYACNMLKTTNYTTAYIANELNYNSLSHFNKVFKQHVGCTPNEYRKKYFPRKM